MLGQFRGVIVLGLAAFLLAACQAPAGYVGPTGSLGRQGFVRELDSNLIPVSTALPEGKQTATVPAGFLAFCLRERSQCGTSLAQPAQVVLNEQTWLVMNQANIYVNTVVRPQDDLSHYGRPEYWAIPADGRGDCDDYALAKKQRLLAAGLPERALRVAVVNNWRGDRHAVLTVATDKGDYVLDNMRGDILPWARTDYTYLGRQDPNRPWGWVSLDNEFDLRPTATSSTVALVNFR